MCSDAVKPCWEDNRKSRGSDGNHVSRKNKTKITFQVEQTKVKRKVAELPLSGGDDCTSVTEASISGTSVSKITTSTDRSGLAFGDKNANKNKK